MFQKILEMPGAPGMKVSLVDNIGFKDNPASFFESPLDLRDEFPTEIVEVSDKVIPVSFDFKSVEVSDKGVNPDTHLPGQPPGFFQTDRRHVHGIHVAPVQGQADGIPAFSRGNVQGLSSGKEMDVFSEKQICVLAEGKSFCSEPFIPPFLI